MSYENYKNKGLTGLCNLGNTCFLNSTMQCLSHSYDFNNMLNTEKYKNKINKDSSSLILIEWDNLRKLMWSENCIISPKGFVRAVQKVARIKDRELFTGYAQNDLPEFLEFIIECFHMAIKREVKMNISGNAITETDKLAKLCYNMMKNMYKKEYSEMLKFFYGIHISYIESTESNYVNITPEPFFNLQLPIPEKNNINLTDCIELYLDKETLEDKILIEDTNKKESCIKKIEFWSLPDILIITFKRFNVSTHSIRKNQIFIDFPLTNLDLRKYVVGYDNNKYIYDLYGICNHSGSCEGGHYTAYVKNANKKWYHFNDSDVSEVTNLDELKSTKAYCLFYRKIK